MARQETIISVFVASPEDLDEERNRLEDVIREFNATWARNLGIRIELIRWETHAYPSFGKDPQAVINEQLPQDFDLFIGLMWYKFGTPTDRAGSGTVEEFQRAKERYDADSNSLQLMIYFKDAPAPIPPSQLDYTQLANVSRFRSSLGEEGGLYWSFQTADEFEKIARIHLARFLQTWRTSFDAFQPPPISIEGRNRAEGSARDDEDDEPGFLELIEQFEDEFSTLIEISERIANATLEIGEKMKARTAETTEFSANTYSNNRTGLKRLLTRVAADMNQYVHRMESEIPLFGKHLNIGMTAFTKFAAMWIEFNTGEKELEQLEENKKHIQEFRETMDDVEEKLVEFREAIASVPRMTVDLNRSRRATVKVIQRLIDEIHRAKVMAREIESSFESIFHSNSTHGSTALEK